MNIKRYLGIAIVLLSLAGGIAYKMLQDRPLEAIHIKGLIGSEKQGFFENPEVRKILLERYGLVVEYAKAGSIDMVQGNVEKEDFLFPGSQVAVELFGKTHPEKKAKIETIFNSPVVIYSWDIVAEALEKRGIVRRVDNAWYIVRFPELVELIRAESRWQDIGLPSLYGKIQLIPTDPTKSNSGSQFAGLLANMLAGGDVVDEAKLPTILPELTSFFRRIGFMERSTGYLFEQFLTTGVGSKPMIVGYESQIIEYCMQHKESCDLLRDKVRILYPEPTVWSSHTLIVLSDAGHKLIEALKDAQIQEIAWKQNGFRSGIAGVGNDPGILNIMGIPKEITKVMPMPSITVMDQIISHLQTP